MSDSLRNRVAVTFALFAGVVSLALALLIFFTSHDLEARLIDDTLSAELDDFVLRIERNPQSIPERTATILAYVIDEPPNPSVPAEVMALGPGRYLLALEEHPYQAAVREVDGRRFAVLYDTTALSQRERTFALMLAGSVILMTLVSALAGRRLAGRVIAPVNELARMVAELEPAGKPVPLAKLFPWQEVRLLAADFDDYQLRLHAFIERERLFTGDVSHELRTPLAVINGATELLLDDPAIEGKNRDRVARIGRAVLEMGEISGALLALAREQELMQQQPAPCNVAELATELLARYRNLLHGKPVTLRLEQKDEVILPADRTVLAMVLGNLLRNALSHTESGEICITTEAKKVVLVEDTGSGLDEADSARLFERYVRGRHSQGAGLGLSLVKRLCDSQGWQIALSNRPNGGTQARLQLQPPAS